MTRLHHYLLKLIVIVLLASSLLGCQYGKVCEKSTLDPAKDPLASFNKKVFNFNMGLDRSLSGPISETYRFVIPLEARDSISKVISNLGEPHIIANDLLQGNWGQAKSDALRFTLNTTAGIGGLFDPASSGGFPRYEQNFGVTAGIWGIPEGPYLTLPLLGPTTVSNLPDIPMRQLTTPLLFLPTLLPFLNDIYLRPSVSGAKQVDQATGVRQHMKAIRNSVNPYVFVRSGYRQRQLKMMKRDCKKQKKADQFEGIDLLQVDDF